LTTKVAFNVLERGGYDESDIGLPIIEFGTWIVTCGGHEGFVPSTEHESKEA
jgi:hypothetical protein